MVSQQILRLPLLRSQEGCLFAQRVAHLGKPALVCPVHRLHRRLASGLLARVLRQVMFLCKLLKELCPRLYDLLLLLTLLFALKRCLNLLASVELQFMQLLTPEVLECVGVVERGRLCFVLF